MLYDKDHKSGMRVATRFWRLALNLEPAVPLGYLTDYLLAVETGDEAADQLLDELIAKLPMEQLAEAVTNLLVAGPTASWAGALNLAGLLAGEHPQMWPTLVQAIESRQDLGTRDLITGIALLQVGGRLPEAGRCRELANEWAEFPETGQNAILRQVEMEPESAFLILEGLGDCSPDQRWELYQEIAAQAPGRIRSRILEWLSFVPESQIAGHAGAELQKYNSTEPSADQVVFESPFFGWVTDLTATGQFGAGLEWTGDVSQQVILGGSWTQGMRIFERLDGDSEDSDFIPDLKKPREVCTHLTLIKKWAVALIESGWHKEVRPSAGAWSAGIVREMLLNWSAEDETTWESWTKILVESNPINSSAEALKADAALVCQAVPHWFVADELAKELATELRGKVGDLFEHRLQSAARIWFERSLGPTIGRLLVNLHAMSYFWLALAETDVMNQQKLVSQARAAARIVADLNDPARIVATHPMIKAWSEEMLRNAIG